MKALTWSGFTVRFIFAFLLVFATYNPSGYSYYNWLKAILPDVDPYMALAGITLAIGWVIYLRATLRSLGIIGLSLVAAVCACILWVLFDWGILNLERTSAITWVVLFFQAIILTLGMSWSHIRRRMSGQVDVDSVDEDV